MNRTYRQHTETHIICRLAWNRTQTELRHYSLHIRPIKKTPNRGPGHRWHASMAKLLGWVYFCLFTKNGRKLGSFLDFVIIRTQHIRMKPYFSMKFVYVCANGTGARWMCVFILLCVILVERIGFHNTLSTQLTCI